MFFFVSCGRRFVGFVAFIVNTGVLEELQVFTLLSLFQSLWVWGEGGREGNLPHQKNIFCVTLKVMSKALKHVIMPWHVSGTWPIYDLNVVFKCRYRVFPFVFGFICYAFCFAYGKEGICTCIHWHLTSLIREVFLYQFILWILQNNLTQT